MIAQLVAGNIYVHYTPFRRTGLQIKKDAAGDRPVPDRDMTNVGVSVFFGFKTR